MPKVKKICVVCGSKFYIWNSRGPQKLCSRSCYSIYRTGKPHNYHPIGEKNGRWNGGRRLDKNGYVLIFSPNHPFRSSDGCVREHRLVMEQFIGRYLKPEEVVHHINRIKDDNRLENLQLMTKKEHDILHLRNYWNISKTQGSSAKTTQLCDGIIPIKTILITKGA